MTETRPVSLKTIDDTFTVDEFLIWAAQQPEGRFELHLGKVVQMAPEPYKHALTKHRACRALEDAITAKKLPCVAVPDGLTVTTDEGDSYEPDALIHCDATQDENASKVANPVVIVEVLSRSTKHIDSGVKLPGYLSIPSVEHVLLLDPDRRIVIHHRRDAPIAILGEGELTLDPPGLSVAVEDLFPSLPSTAPDGEAE